MVLLFRSGTYVTLTSPGRQPRMLTRAPPSDPRLREKLTLVFRATKSHARNLATFVALYKATCLVLKYWGSTPGKEGGTPALAPTPSEGHPRSRDCAK